ncbi:MAG: ABC transporter ATP-binding protein [Candidatus Dormibacteria bacterium]
MHRGGYDGPAVRTRAQGPERRRLLGRVVRLFRPYKRQVGLVGLAILVTAGLGVASPLLIGVVFDTALFPKGAHHQVLPPNLPRLYVLVGFMVAIPIISSIIGVGQTFLTNKVGQRVMQDLRNTLYRHLQDMSLRFFTSTRTGEIQSRLTNDVAGVQTVVTDTASSILANVVTLVSTVVAMTILSWQLTALSLALVPFFLVLTYRAGNARRAISARAQASKAEMSAIMEETLSVSGILLSKVFGRKEEEIERFAGENERLATLAIRREMIGRSLFAMVGIFFSISPALVYLVAGLVVHSNGLEAVSAGTIVAFTTLQSRLFFPIGSMLQVSVEVQASLALFERIFEYLDMRHDIVDAPDAIVLDRAALRGEVELRKVWFRYEEATGLQPDAPGETAAEGSERRRTAAARDEAEGSRVWALRDLSLHVRPGQLAAIVGASGAGKTTISYVVPRLYDVTRGQVLLDGVDVRRLKLGSIADIVGMVTQETYLFHDTVRRNLMYARPDAGEDEMIAAAKAAFIHERITQLSDGYDTMVGERGYRMSGGEKQRLAIARVALKAPSVLILDEATSALDTTSERLVQAALRPLMAGRTTIAIAHRLSTILAADVIFVVDAGQVIEQGTHGELISRGGKYAELYEQQFGGGRVEARCEDGVVMSTGEVVGAAASR